MTEPATTLPIADAVPLDGAAAREINFKIAERYNASEFSFTISQPAAAIISP